MSGWRVLLKASYGGFFLHVALMCGASQSCAFNLTPIYEDAQNRISAPDVPRFLSPIVDDILEQFGDPVHESLTAMMYGCERRFEECGEDPREAPDDVVDGVEWNDNPTFGLSSRSFFCPNAKRANYVLNLDSDPICWLTLFYDAQRRASGTPGAHFSGVDQATPKALIYRVHFGDLQFLHSMASWDGEKASETQRHVMAWLEFTYKLRNGEIADLSMPIAAAVPTLQDAFAHNGFSARSLFKPRPEDASSANDETVRQMALGSLLHTLEDSYSTAHTRRDAGQAGHTCPGFADAALPGRILTFYSYNHQVGAKHKVSDTTQAAQDSLKQTGQVVLVGKQVLAFLKEHRLWADVQPYFMCVMEISTPDALSGPGSFGR